MAWITALQRRVEQLHGVGPGPDVTEFLVDDAVRARLPGARAQVPEQLFVREADGCLDVSLYVEPHLLAALAADDPHRRLHGGNLAAYCVALEGVSHFVMLSWRARVGWPVTALELEIQAEVDKFALGLLQLTRQGASPPLARRALRAALFDHYALHPGTRGDEADRYHVANRVARGFCAGLAPADSRPPARRALVVAVRQFHRRGLQAKLRLA